MKRGAGFGSFSNSGFAEFLFDFGLGSQIGQAQSLTSSTSPQRTCVVFWHAMHMISLPSDLPQVIHIYSKAVLPLLLLRLWPMLEDLAAGTRAFFLFGLAVIGAGRQPPLQDVQNHFSRASAFALVRPAHLRCMTFGQPSQTITFPVLWHLRHCRLVPSFVISSSPLESGLGFFSWEALFNLPEEVRSVVSLPWMSEAALIFSSELSFCDRMIFDAVENHDHIEG